MNPAPSIAAALAFSFQLDPAAAGAGEFDPRQVVPPVRAITDAHISEPSAVSNKIEGGDLVLGLRVGESARAYPINMLTGPQREIINDELGGRAIAATW